MQGYLTTWEWVAVAMGVGGATMAVAPDLFGIHERWGRYGGTVLTLGGLITGILTMQMHRRAKAVMRETQQAMAR